VDLVVEPLELDELPKGFAHRLFVRPLWVWRQPLRGRYRSPEPNPRLAPASAPQGQGRWMRAKSASR
jgi:hypothetical protein